MRITSKANFSKSHLSKLNHGFSLMEISVVLIVIAIIGGLGISFGTAQIKMANVTNTEQTLQNVNKAFLTYVKKTGRYPCPANPTLASTDAAYGLEVTGCDTACPAGLTCNANAIEGAIPFKTINLSEASAYDSWQNKLTYVVDKTHVVASGHALGTLPVYDSAINEITASSTVLGKAVFMTLSHGKDGKGAYKKDGTLYAACGATTMDSENCDRDGVYVATNINDEGSETTAVNYYNDYMEWNTQANVQDESAAPAVAGVVEVHKVTGGEAHSCAISTTNQLYCWGENGDGQLGDGTTSQRLTPTLVNGGFSNWSFISSSAYHTCGILSDGRLYCWGLNWDGQLGDGTNTDRNTPTLVSGGFTDWKTVSVGYQSTCAIRQNGKLYCWGWWSNTPSEIAGFSDWNQVGIYDGETVCAVRSTGEGYCWQASWESPNLVSGGLSWKKIKRNFLNTCGLTTTNQVYCWGDNSGNHSGGLGNHFVTDTPTPMEVSTSSVANSYKSLASMCEFSCAIHTDGKAYCWGKNDDGRLGSNFNNPEWSPTAVISSITNWEYIAGGHNHVCAITADQQLYCWGNNGSGQLGDGTTNTTHIPQLITLP